ncbi:hypothetical protein KFE80_00035 [bacterium SCSIO 12696]|nr:hypothetical protein KFE80_00035 [bacterium SCSIO 12696]
MYLLFFACIDLVLFFCIYFFHSLFLKGFGVTDAILNGGYEIFWRVLSFQLLIQILLLLFSNLWGGQKFFWVVLASTAISFLIASAISFSEISAVWKLLWVSAEDGLGEGFVLLLSSSLAWLLLRVISNN